MDVKKFTVRLDPFTTSRLDSLKDYYKDFGLNLSYNDIVVRSISAHFSELLRANTGDGQAL